MNRRFGGLETGLHVVDAVTEARAACDVDDVAPLVTAEGRWAASWSGILDACRATLSSERLWTRFRRAQISTPLDSSTSPTTGSRILKARKNCFKSAGAREIEFARIIKASLQLW